jgi:hypothetical protein
MELKEFKDFKEADNFFKQINCQDELYSILELINKGVGEYKGKQTFIEYWNKGLMETENRLILKHYAIGYVLVVYLINELRTL